VYKRQDEGFLAQVRQKGAYFKEKLEALGKKHSKVKAVRGKGLLLGLELDTSSGQNAGFYVEACFKKGFIINGIQDKVLRFAPPLIVETADIDRLADVLDTLLTGEDH